MSLGNTNFWLKPMKPSYPTVSQNYNDCDTKDMAMDRSATSMRYLDWGYLNLRHLHVSGIP